jgi:protein ImuA
MLAATFAPPEPAVLDDLRRRIGGLERRAAAGSVPVGLAAIDAHLPAGGLARAALHEIAGAGAQVEHAGAATLLTAGLLGRLRGGRILWVLQQADLFPPALAGVGLAAERVIYVAAGTPATVLLVMEEGLRHRGLAAVVGEFSGRLGLTASRRLQLAAEASGVMAILLRRSRHFADPALAAPSAAVTRWRVAALPSPPALAQAPDTPGLARGRWRLELTRSRGGVPGAWTVEACDAQGHLSLAADLADRPAAPAVRRAAG